MNNTIALPSVAVPVDTDTVARRNRPVPAELAAVPVASNVQVAPDARAVLAFAGTVTLPYAGFESESLYVYVVEPAGTANGSTTALQ